MAAAATAVGALDLEEEEEEEEEEEDVGEEEKEEDQARRGKADDVVIEAAVRAHERLNKRVEADMAVSWVCMKSVGCGVED